jgi:hypothetical protein
MFGQSKEKTLIRTKTGELYQPARVYYEVSNQKTVLGMFKKLRCIEWEPSMNAWRWLYEQEAKKLKFEISWNRVPKEDRPLVLGDFYFRGEQELILEVRSFVRVTHAILFFDKHINRRVARVTKIRILNRLLDASNPRDSQHLHPPFDHFFDRDDIEIPDSEATVQKMEALARESEDPETGLQALHAYIEEKAKKPVPEIEEIPVHFYDDGIMPLEMALMMRNMEAVGHWQGNKNLNQYDLMMQLLQGLQNDLTVQEQLKEAIPETLEAEVEPVVDQEDAGEG